MPGTFSPSARVSDPDMHHGTCVTHVPWCMPGSLTSGFPLSRWQRKLSRHYRRMRSPQFYVSCKRSMGRPVTHRFVTHEAFLFRWWDGVWFRNIWGGRYTMSANSVVCLLCAYAGIRYIEIVNVSYGCPLRGKQLEEWLPHTISSSSNKMAVLHYLSVMAFSFIDNSTVCTWAISHVECLPLQIKVKSVWRYPPNTHTQTWASI